MRLILAAFCVAACASMASAQTLSGKSNRPTLSTALAARS
jgi:hypothetical protein